MRERLDTPFVEHLTLINEIVAAIRRRHRLAPSDVDEFASFVHGRLIEDDQRILRSFEGRSSLHTYLTAVIERLYLDFRVAHWGKWRPSAVAVRIGHVAIQLETLLMRDRLSFEEAVGVMTTIEGHGTRRDQLYAIAVQLPPRISRRALGDEEASEPFAEAADVEDGALLPERRALVRRALATLGRAVETLEPSDRLILRMRFVENSRIATIAAELDLAPKPLYRRLERLLRQLREELEADGLTGPELAMLIGRPDFDLLASD